MFSDVVGALGWVHDAVVGCAYPELVGRDVVSVQSTRELERFPLDRGLLGMGMLRTVDVCACNCFGPLYLESNISALV